MASTRASISVVPMSGAREGEALLPPAEVRASTLKAGGAPRLPKPRDPRELEKRFTQVLASMDLPPDKAKVLKSYDEDKKWDIICDQELVSAKNPPEFYLNKLRVLLDPTASKSLKKRNKVKRQNSLRESFRRFTERSNKRRLIGDGSSTQTLRDLEISLRTNHIEWVRSFLSEDHRGLDVLVDYLSFTQLLMRKEMEMQAASSPEAGADHHANGTFSAKIQRRKTNMKQSSSKLNFSEATDDVHVCIMCLRAIMNHQYGFNLVFAHKQAINCIALSLNHKSMRTKALVLELLAAVCLVSGGHELIINSFDHFKEVCNEKHRFQTLISYFTKFDEFHIDFMVACMQFINIVVHSTEDMNFRVHLQHEFTLLGLDMYLDKLRTTESSDRLTVQINAYLDNMIDVKLLLDDSEMKNTALERAADLELSLSHAKERAQEIEDEAIDKIAELESYIAEITGEAERLREVISEQEQAILRLHEDISSKDAESRQHQTMLEDKMRELEDIRNKKMGVSSPGSSPTKPLSGPPAPPPPAPPPPPPSSAPPPPPPPGAPPPPLPGAPVTIKRKITTKYRLPVLNWVAMKPNQVKGTIFSELDDEKLYSEIDFGRFEEMFKLGNTSLQDVVDGSPKFKRKPEAVSLLEPNRLRNVAITKRKMELRDEDIVRAINSFDLKVLPTERVEILQRILPNEKEVKAFKEYEKDKKPIGVLSDEDKFLLSFYKMERASVKLNIMGFIGNFFDSYHLIQPQLNAVVVASTSIKNSKKVRKMLEIVLAFGNYMNSNKRGAVYGFKLQSLDTLVDAKSNDKKITLLHFIVDTVKTRFPTVANFEAELRFMEKASTVSLENVAQDIAELEKGMELTKREYESRCAAKDREPPLILKDFLNNSQDKMKKLKIDLKSAQEAYVAVVEYFGENPKTLAPNTFFSIFSRFVHAYRQSAAELDEMRKMERAERARETEKQTLRQKLGNTEAAKKLSQEAVMSELRQKQKAKQIREKKVLNRDEVYHGALEDILLDLKNEPYRRADAVRRSQRKRYEMDLGPSRDRENTKF